MEEKVIWIAAVLHDIGIFRSVKDEDVDHVSSSVDFINEMKMDKRINEIILHHHDSLSELDFFGKILKKSDRDSGEEEKETKEEQLVSIFSKIRITEGNTPKEYYLPLKILDSNDFNNPSLEKRRYNHIWDNFLEEAKILREGGKIDDFTSLLSLLKKYTTFAPSAAGRDVSLYEHLRMTSALATSLYHYSKEKELSFDDDEQCYMLIYGGMSGIQRFIYRISSPQDAQKGMSKRLRGRSLYLNLINDAIATRIVHDLNLTEANIVSCGGGHFLITAPNTDSAREKLDKIGKEVNERFIEQYNAELYLLLSTKSCSGADLRNFGSLQENIEFEIMKKKRQKFNDNLEIIFEDEKKAPKLLCPVCGNERSEKEAFCLMCNRHEKLGEKVANATYLFKAISEDAKGFDIFDIHEFNVGYKFVKKKDAREVASELGGIIEKSENTTVLKLNETNYLDKALLERCKDQNVSFGFSLIANIVPRCSEGILYFDHMAKISKGSDKIGVLKMDVDDLGKIFAKGLGDGVNISRVSTLSSFLDIFFLGYINSIAEQHCRFEVCDECKEKIEEKKRTKLTFENNEKVVTVEVCREGEQCSNCVKIPTIYITYSGGDDILIVGPYDDLILFAKDLSDEFKRWRCENDDISISAGVFIAGHKFPIGEAAQRADKELEKSKDRENNKRLSLTSADRGKSRMTVFNETVRWDSFEPIKGFNELSDFAIYIEQLVEGGTLSKSFVYSLLYLWRDTFGDENELNDKIRLEWKRYVPHYRYMLARGIKGNIKDEQVNRLRDDLAKNGVKYMPWIKIPVSWVSFRTR
jgi:CRISPR-associated protein Csm1